MIIKELIMQNNLFAMSYVFLPTWLQESIEVSVGNWAKQEPMLCLGGGSGGPRRGEAVKRLDSVSTKLTSLKIILQFNAWIYDFSHYSTVPCLRNY